MSADEAPTSIDLARETAFGLGGLGVRPSTREVTLGKRREVLEPRVMQVLVALARRRGEVVSRDELIAACWGGRVVGEDAIQRCIGAIRRLAKAHGGFHVHTVTRVGYRLDVGDDNTEMAGLRPEPVLAVLAFDNLSGDPEMAYFSDGVSEEIRDTVARSAGLKVIGRASSFQFRGANKAAAHISERLGATHVLDGSIRRSGRQVRISTDLVECLTQTTLWSNRFDRELTDIFQIQDEIAEAVAAALKAKFGAPAPGGQVTPAAYDLYLRAGESFKTILDAKARLAQVSLLEQATSLAPGFGRAWALLASVQASLLQRDEVAEPYSIVRARAVKAAETALDLDPNLGRVHQTLGELEPRAAYARREALHERALSVSPNEAVVLTSAALFLAETGRVAEAVRYAKQANDLDPMDHWVATWCATLLDYADRYEESRALSDRCCSLWPDSDRALFHAVASAASNRDWPRFDRLVEHARIRGLLHRPLTGLVWLGSAQRDPDPAKARTYLARARDRLDQTGTVPIETFTGLYQLGLRDEVFEMVDAASFEHVFDTKAKSPDGVNPSVVFSRSHSGDLMRDPRFVRFCGKLALTDYWLETGKWPDCADEVPYDFRADVRRLARARG